MSFNVLLSTLLIFFLFHMQCLKVWETYKSTQVGYYVVCKVLYKSSNKELILKSMFNFYMVNQNK